MVLLDLVAFILAASTGVAGTLVVFCYRDSKALLWIRDHEWLAVPGGVVFAVLGILFPVTTLGLLAGVAVGYFLLGVG